jgi:hypothetical protein
VIATYWDGKVPLVIADRNAWAVAGHQVATTLTTLNLQSKTIAHPTQKKTISCIE